MAGRKGLQPKCSLATGIPSSGCQAVTPTVATVGVSRQTGGPVMIAGAGTARGGGSAGRRRRSSAPRPFLLRRSKEEVVQDLPHKTENVEPVEPVKMEAAQRAIYEGIRLAMHAKVKAAMASCGLARSGIMILDALL